MCKVIIKQAENYDDQTVYMAVKEIMLQQRINSIINGDTTILIKPNMLARRTPDKAVTTHPVVLDAVITVLKEFGAKSENITVADSSGGPGNRAVLRGNYGTCGFSLIAQNHGVNLCTKLKSKTVKTNGVAVKEFEIINQALDCDVVINLPKMKTHVMTGMSGAVKNLFGVVPGMKKAEFHMRFPQKENFADMLVDLCETVKPEFTIVDGIIAMEGDGPSGGYPKSMGMLIAGTNPYYIDLAIAHIMGFDPMALPVSAAAAKRGLCPEELPNNCIIGDTWLYKKHVDFALPKSYNMDFSDRVPRALRWATPTVEKILAPKPKINRSKCIGCGKCRDICPQKVITIVDKKANIDYHSCIKCFCCHEMCPAKAIDVKRNIFFNI